MLDSDGSVHLETNGQTFISISSSVPLDPRHVLVNVLRLGAERSMSLALSDSRFHSFDKVHVELGDKRSDKKKKEKKRGLA
jgi:hypothetical protein